MDRSGRHRHVERAPGNFALQDHAAAFAHETSELVFGRTVGARRIDEVDGIGRGRWRHDLEFPLLQELITRNENPMTIMSQGLARIA